MSSSKNLEYKKTSFLNKSNSAFIEQMYLKFINKDSDLPESWRNYFLDIGEEMDLVVKEINGPKWSPQKKKINLEEIQKNLNNKDQNISKLKQTKYVDDIYIKKSNRNSIRAVSLIRSYRQRGHLISKIDPLELREIEYLDELHPESYGFNKEDYKNNDFSNLKIYGSHGTVDQVIPIEWARKNNPFIDKLIFGKNTLPFYKLVKQIKIENYYAIIDAYSTVKTSIITSFSGANYKIGFDKKYTRPFYTHVFSRKIQAKTNAGAAIEKRMRLLTPLIKNAPLQLKPKIFLSDAEREKAKRILIEGGVDLSDSIYMIGALGSSEKKTYPLPYLAKLLDQMAAKENTAILFNYIPNQKEQISTLIGYCNAQTKQKIYLDIYGKNLREFLALTSFCDAIIGNEGGAINMAKALNIPSFAIFSPPLNKANWNIYEDGKQNVSVHLKDFSPELFAEKSQDDLHKDVFELYEKFLPAYIEEPLDQFLKLNTK